MIDKILGEMLEWFDPEDQDLLRASWNAIFDLMLTPYQELLEREMSTSINTIVPLKKKFYETYRMSYTQKEISISSFPHALPVGYSNVRAFGDPEWTSEEVVLPVDLGPYATDIVTSDEVTIDGTKLLGSGTVKVEYKTIYKGMATIENGNVTGPVDTTYVLADVPLIAPVALSGNGEILANGKLYDPSVNFRSMRVGSSIRLYGGFEDTITEIIDDHTIKTEPNLPLMTTRVGMPIGYSIEDAFPYTMSTDAVTIPQIGEYMEGIDYVVEDGVLAFSNDPGTGLLIAYISFYLNDQLSDRFGKPIGYALDNEDVLAYHKKLVALWHSIFDVSDKKRMEFLLSAFIGLPYIGPWDGESIIEEIQYDYTKVRPPIDFTFSNEYNKLDVVTTPSDYFFCSDKVILLDGGRFLRVTDVVNAREAKVEGVIPHGQTVRGSVGDYRFTRMSYRNSKGAQVIIDIPTSAVPIYKPEESVPVWSKLFTGIRVRDRVDRYDYEVADATKFYESGAVSSLDAVRRMLVANTFLLEVDYDTVDLTKLGKVKAAWTQYQELGRSDFQAMGLNDRLVLEVVFGYVFTSMYTSPVNIAIPDVVNENNCWVNQSQPRVFDGVVTDGSTPGIDFDGTIEITIPAARKFSVTRNYTIMTRVNFDTIGVDQWILTRDGQFRFGITAALPGEMVLQVYDGGMWNTYNSTGAGLVWNTWYTLAVVVDDTNITFYVDTTANYPVAHALTAPEVNPTADLYIGYDGTTRMTGELDYVNMWAVPLTQSEINSYITTGVALYDEYILARYELNTGSGTAAVDSSIGFYGFDRGPGPSSVISWAATDKQWECPVDLTILCRFCITNNGKALVLISEGVSAGDADWEIRLDTVGSDWKFQFLSEGSVYSTTSNLSDEVLNQWCTAAISITGTSARMIIWKNGDAASDVDNVVPVVTERSQNASVAAIGGTIGSIPLSGVQASAIIRDVRVYNYSLTATEIIDYTLGGDPRYWDEILNIPCDETSGSTAEDHATNHMVVI